MDYTLLRLPTAVCAPDEPAGGPPPDPSPAGSPPVEPAPVSAMPEGLPVQYWDQTTGLKTDELVADYLSLAQARDAAAQGVPDDPSGYTLALPEDLEIPAGLEIKFDENSEFVQSARAAATELGLNTTAWTKLLALDAQRQIAEYRAVLDEDKAEKEKLGPQGEARITAVESFLKANLDQEKYSALRPVIFNAMALEAMEDLIKKANSSGVSIENPTPPPPVPPQPERMADRWYGPEQKAS